MKKSARKRGEGSADAQPDDRYRKIFGITALCLAGYLGLAFIAYLFTWKADQDSVLTFGWGILFEDVEVANWLGPLGAISAHTAFFNGFGAMSFLLVYLMAVTGMAVLQRRPLVHLQRQLRWGLAGLMLLSIILAFLFQMMDFPVGGAYGYLIASSLESLIGLPGMLLLLAMSIVLLFVWIFNPTLEEIKTGAILQRIELSPSLAGVGQAISLKGFGRRERSDEKDADVDDGASGYDDSPAGSKSSTRRGHSATIQSYEGDEEEPEASLSGAPAATAPDATCSSAANAEEELPVGLLDDDGPAVATTPPKAATRSDDFQLEVTYASGDPVVDADDDDDDDDDADIGAVPANYQPRAGEKPRDVLAAEAEHELAEQGPYDPKLDLRNYRYPEISLLKKYPDQEHPVTDEELEENKSQIVDSLMSFGLQIMNISATVGPTITLYEIIPAPGQRIAKFRNLSDDIALSLSALGIRIIAPMPGRGSIGVEVPNKNRQMVPAARGAQL